jgi:hypothetical protein
MKQLWPYNTCVCTVAVFKLYLNNYNDFQILLYITSKKHIILNLINVKQRVLHLTSTAEMSRGEMSENRHIRNCTFAFISCKYCIYFTNKHAT